MVAKEIEAAVIKADYARKMKALAAGTLCRLGVLDEGKRNEFVNDTNYKGKTKEGKYILDFDPSLFSEFTTKLSNEYALYNRVFRQSQLSPEQVQKAVENAVKRNIQLAFGYAELGMLFRPL
jgi:hypothetical protein